LSSVTVVEQVKLITEGSPVKIVKAADNSSTYQAVATTPSRCGPAAGLLLIPLWKPCPAGFVPPMLLQQLLLGLAKLRKKPEPQT
jgi:hypothetical protein